MRVGLLAVLLIFTNLYAADPPPQAAMSTPVVNLYSAPSLDSDVVSQALFGTSAEIIETKDGWSKVQTPDHYTGWIEAIASVAGPYAATTRVSALFANLYRETNITRHQPVLTLPFGAVLKVAAEENDRWLKVELPDKRTAFVQRGDVGPLHHKLTPMESIELSKRFLGLPYLWGGTSSFGYDCSGFTQMLVQQRGILMPRDADIQAAWQGVKAVTRDELQPGDLLFFGPSDKRITHTGYYIGDGQFIHATAHLKPVIQISMLDDPHWSELLVASRRLQ